MSKIKLILSMILRHVDLVLKLNSEDTGYSCNLSKFRLFLRKVHLVWVNLIKIGNHCSLYLQRNSFRVSQTATRSLIFSWFFSIENYLFFSTQKLFREIKIRKKEIPKKIISPKIWKKNGNFSDTDGWDCKSFFSSRPGIVQIDGWCFLIPNKL